MRDHSRDEAPWYHTWVEGDVVGCAREYEFVTHTADVAVVVRGADVPRLLCNAAAALYALTLGERSIGTDLCRRLVVDSASPDTLVVDWLNELLYHLCAERLAFSLFEFDEMSGSRVVARCRGMRLDAGAMRLHREVKAATYHMATLVCGDAGYTTRIVFDV